MITCSWRRQFNVGISEVPVVKCVAMSVHDTFMMTSPHDGALLNETWRMVSCTQISSKWRQSSLTFQVNLCRASPVNTSLALVGGVRLRLVRKGPDLKKVLNGVQSSLFWLPRETTDGIWAWYRTSQSISTLCQQFFHVPSINYIHNTSLLYQEGFSVAFIFFNNEMEVHFW